MNFNFSDMTPAFIVSQIFTVLGYGGLIWMMFCFKKSKLIKIAIFMNIFFVIAYAFQSAYSGLAMVSIGLVQVTIEFFVLKKTLPEKTKYWLDRLVYIPIIVCGYFSYEGFGSLLSVFGELIYIYSISLKKTLNIKLVMIISSLFWITYTVFIGSPMGVFFEVVLFFVKAIGIFFEFRRQKNN